MGNNRVCRMVQSKEVAVRKVRTAESRTEINRKRSAGFITVALMIFAPVTLVILSAVAGLALILKFEVRAAAECDHAVFSLQDQRAKKLNELLRHNSAARRLMRSKSVWQKRLAAAEANANAPAIAICVAELARITSAQIALAAVQHAIIDSSDQESRFSAHAARNKMSFAVSQFDSGRLLVRASPPLQMAPEYHPVENFFQNQRVTMEYSSPLATILASRFSLLADLRLAQAPLARSLHHHQCSATIVDRELNEHFQSQMTDVGFDE